MSTEPWAILRRHPLLRRLLRIQLHHCSTTGRRIACPGGATPVHGAAWLPQVRFRDELTGESGEADGDGDGEEAHPGMLSALNRMH